MELDIYRLVLATVPAMELDIHWPVLVTVPSVELKIYWPVLATVPSVELDIYWPVLTTVSSVELDKFCMEKQLTTKLLRMWTSLPFAYNIYRYLILHLQSLFSNVRALCQYPRMSLITMKKQRQGLNRYNVLHDR